MYTPTYYPGQKKNHPRDSRREERCSTCDIMLDQARSAQGKSRGQSRIGLALRWSRLIEHDITRGTAFFSPRISMMVLFFGRGSTYLLYAVYTIIIYVYTTPACVMSAQSSSKVKPILLVVMTWCWWWKDFWPARVSVYIVLVTIIIMSNGLCPKPGPSSRE